MEREIGISDIYSIILKRWKLFMILMISMIISGIGLNVLLNNSEYYSDTILIVGEESERDTEEINKLTGEPIKEKYISYGTHTVSAQELKFYEDILNSNSIINELILKTELDMSLEEMKDSISIKVPEDSGTIVLSISGEKLKNADYILKSLIPIFEDKVESIVELDLIKVLDPVTDVTKRNTINIRRNLIATIIISVTMSLVIVIVLEFLDDKVRTIEQITNNLELLLSGEVSTELRIEDMKKIRTNLIMRPELKNKKILTFSSINNEVNNFIIDFAEQIAKTKKRILLIDADLRNDKRSEENSYGLTDIIEGNATLEKVILKQKYYDFLSVGTSIDDPSEKMSSDEMKNILLKVENMYDYVIIIGPPIDKVTDTIAMSKSTDGIILIEKVGTTKLNDLKKMSNNLETLEIDLLGVILEND